MLAIFFTMALLRTALLIPKQEEPISLSLIKAQLGDAVTLPCAALDGNIQVFYWYKQSHGHVPELVASLIYGSRMIYPPYKSRVTLDNGTDFNLTLSDVHKEDEANFYCLQGIEEKDWNNGAFLSVEDGNEQTVDYQTVVQQSAAVQLGDPVALQCSVTSQRTDHRNQSQEEPSLYSFRSGSGPSHPAAIYMNGNRSCVYTLSKNNVVTSDAGTYYCALAACGEVVFGHGTKLDITESDWHRVNLVLGILLACCLAGIIIILVLTRNKKPACEQCKGTLSTFYHVEHDSMMEKDRGIDSLNYAALRFSAKPKGGTKNSERTRQSLYSAVTCVPTDGSSAVGYGISPRGMQTTNSLMGTD